MIRLLKLEPALIGSVAAAVYAAAAMLYRAYVLHDGVLDMDLLVAAGMALYGLYTRWKVTPVEKPKDTLGRPLRPAQQDQGT
jgi:hypothetical protein